MNDYLIEQYLKNDLRLLSESRYLEFEKTLKKFADKNERDNKSYLEDKKQGNLLFDFKDLSEINRHRKKRHAFYHFFLPLTGYEENPKTMDEFILGRSRFFNDLTRDHVLHRGWEASYIQSIQFIFLFLDEFFFSTFPNNLEDVEFFKLVKFFLAEIYEHHTATLPETDFTMEGQSSLLVLDNKLLGKLVDELRSALDLFHKLIVNGIVYDSDLDPQPRFRDIYTFRSLNILLNSLKEYDAESAMKLMVLIAADFNSLVTFLAATVTSTISVRDLLSKGVDINLIKTIFKGYY
jgi:hypothetical protein